MKRHVRFQRFGEELLRPHIAILMRRPLQPSRIIRRRAFLHPGKYLVLAFGEPIEIIHQINQEEFASELLGKRWLDAKVKCSPTQREPAVSLVVINDSLVVKLGSPDA